MTDEPLTRPRLALRAAFLLAALALAVAFALRASPASAHAFGQRYDLPIPLNYFLLGAAAAVALSFVVVGVFVRGGRDRQSYPRLDLLRTPLIGGVLRSRTLGVAVRAASVATLALLVFAGFFGTNRAIDNISPTFVWIIWWVGMGYVSAMLGDVWKVCNPWRITFEWFRRLRGHADEPEQPPFTYPERLGALPALLLLFVFAWAENVYGAFLPRTLSTAIVVYSAISWAGMAMFGKHAWLRNADPFSVLFGMFARFSPTEIRVADRAVCAECESECAEESECVDCADCFEYAPADRRELNLRPFAVGLALPRRVSGAMAGFVLLALASVSFDGFQDTETWANFRADMLAVASADVVDTLALAAAPALFALAYLGFCAATRLASGDPDSVLGVARAFVFSLAPIAIAYNIAHFISLLLIQGQLIIPLASDPFGFGWDIFGSAEYRLNLEIISAKAVWFISLAAIVVGHVASVYVAHVISLQRTADASAALRGQLPLLALMVLYTVSSLWIIAQPIVL